MEIYAELSRKQLKSVEGGDMEFCLPEGVSLSRRRGSRACYFKCADETALMDLISGLDACWITWQDNFVESEYDDLAKSEYYDREEIIQEIVRGSGRKPPRKRLWSYEPETPRRKPRNAF